MRGLTHTDTYTGQQGVCDKGSFVGVQTHSHVRALMLVPDVLVGTGQAAAGVLPTVFVAVDSCVVQVPGGNRADVTPAHLIARPHGQAC